MAYRVLCGVPQIHCRGGHLTTDQVFTTNKCHSSHPEAFKCMRNYLVNVLHFEQVGPREFIEPDSGRIRVLTKKTRFGGHLRTGKEQARYMPKVNRGVIY